MGKKTIGKTTSKGAFEKRRASKRSVYGFSNSFIDKTGGAARFYSVEQYKEKQNDNSSKG